MKQAIATILEAAIPEELKAILLNRLITQFGNELGALPAGVAPEPESPGDAEYEYEDDDDEDEDEDEDEDDDFSAELIADVESMHDSFVQEFIKDFGHEAAIGMLAKSLIKTSYEIGDALGRNYRKGFTIQNDESFPTIKIGPKP